MTTLIKVIGVVEGVKLAYDYAYKGYRSSKRRKINGRLRQ